MQRKKGIKKGSALANDFATSKQREKEVWTMKVMKYMFQYTLDLATLTLASDAFGFGPVRLRRFAEAFSATYDEIRALEDDSSEQSAPVNGIDLYNTYAKSKVEDALKAACGDFYVPREERYKLDIVTPEGKRIQAHTSTL